MVIRSITESPLKTKNEAYTGVLMGYGTIASNGVAHGLKAPNPKILIYIKLYTGPEGIKYSFRGLKSLTIKTQVCSSQAQRRNRNPVA